MIKIRPASQRGKTQTQWLESHHTFSFNRYYNPEYSGFRDLLVINEDFVKPAQGFGAHSHDNMEILSYVIEGAVDHKDSTGAQGTLRPHELQRMSAGTGVTHSEFNPSPTESTHFLQIWILPERDGLRPEYEQRSFPDRDRQGRLRLLASRDGRDGSVTIHQDVALYDAVLSTGQNATHTLAPGHHAWVQVVRGRVLVNGTSAGPSDGVALSNETAVQLHAESETEILLFDLR